jgi:hypothetical protein
MLRRPLCRDNDRARSEKRCTESAAGTSSDGVLRPTQGLERRPRCRHYVSPLLFRSIPSPLLSTQRQPRARQNMVNVGSDAPGFSCSIKFLFRAQRCHNSARGTADLSLQRRKAGDTIRNNQWRNGAPRLSSRQAKLRQDLCRPSNHSSWLFEPFSFGSTCWILTASGTAARRKFVGDAGDETIGARGRVARVVASS